MRGTAGDTNIRPVRPFLIALLLLGALGGTARAAEVAYVDGDQIWISTLDGQQKRSLSGPSPDEKQWRDVAQADDGTILGVRREGTKMGTFNVTQLWGPDGAAIGNGSLTAPTGRTTYAYPVTLDLTPDGKSVVYGYANSSGFGLGQTFEFGTYAEGTSGWYIQPFDITSVEAGTLVGRRVVGIGGTVVYVQDDASGDPYSTSFPPWFDAGGIGADVDRVEVAATGTVAAVEVGESGSQQVAMIPFGSLGGPLPADGSDCFLPTQGDATDVSISQDATTMAWHDDRGVVVAGIPVWFPSVAVSTCNLSRPPVVISATGKMPSIGASTAAVAAVAGGPGPTGGSGKAKAPKIVALSKKLKAAALARGVVLTVRVAAAGKVVATGKVGAKTVATGKVRAKRAGKVKLRLRATKSYRERLGTLKGQRLVIKVTAGGRSTTVVRKLG